MTFIHILCRVMKPYRLFRVVLPAFVALAAASCSNSEPQTGDSGLGPPETVRAVEAVELVAGRLGGEVHVRGRIRGRSEATAVSETQGRIQSVHFDLGDEVRRGDALVRLANRTEQLAVEQAREQLASARTEADAVERRRERGGASAGELSSARANLRGVERQLAQAEEAYENRTIRAPIAGRIASIGASISSGDYIQNGASVARIVDLERLRLEAPVGRHQIASLERGQPARVLIRDCDEDIHARVSAVSAGADRETGSFVVAIEWDRAEGGCGGTLRSGMSASAVIETSRGAEGVLVPTAAFRTDSGGAGSDGAGSGRDQRVALFVVEDGQAVLREVQLLDRLGATGVARSGVSAGETVIVTGVSRLRDGDRVEATRVADSGEIE